MYVESITSIFKADQSFVKCLRVKQQNYWRFLWA